MIIKGEVRILTPKVENDEEKVSSTEEVSDKSSSQKLFDDQIFNQRSDHYKVL
jgi:hypothetical protein